MMPLLLTDNNFVLPDHSSNLYTPPLTVAAAFICTGELTLEPLTGEQTLTPAAEGAEQVPETVKVNDLVWCVSSQPIPLIVMAWLPAASATELSTKE